MGDLPAQCSGFKAHSLGESEIKTLIQFQLLSLLKITRLRITVARRQELDEVHLVSSPDGGRTGDRAQTTDLSPKDRGDVQKMMLINQNGDSFGFFPLFRGNFKSHC